MNKFKKILLGTLSVLTLGLFVVCGLNVHADGDEDTTINVTPGATSVVSGYTYVLNAKTIFTNEGKTAPNDGANVSAANLSAGKLNYGIFTFNSGKSWGFRREDTAYASYDKYGIFSNGSSRTITIALSKGQKIDLTAVVFSTSKGNSTVSTTTNNSSWIAANDSAFTAEYTALKTISDSYTATAATNYVITFNNKIGFTQLSAEISDNTAAEYTISYNLDGGTNPTDAPTKAYDGTIVTLPTPIRKGYKFDGWTLSGGDSTIYTSYTINGANVTFVANWTKTQYGNTQRINISNLSTIGGGIIDGTIFDFDDSQTISNDTRSYSGKSYTKSIKLLPGSVSVSGSDVTTSNGIHINVTCKAGATIKVVCRSTADVARTLKVYDSNGTEVVSDSSTTNVEMGMNEFVVDSNDEYTFVTTSGNLYLYEIIVVDNVTAIQQEAPVGDSTYVRFVFIISNATDLKSTDLTSKLTLILDSGETFEQTVTRTPNVVNKITKNNSTYSGTVNGETYSFDNTTNTRDVYVIYIVEFTTATYLTHTINASLEYKGESYTTSTYTFK